MQTQLDRVHAHDALVARMSAALVVGRTTYEVAPARRVWRGFLAGLVVTLLIGVGVGLYGLLRPKPSTAWRTDGAIVVERETGNRMLWHDGRLVPVLNYSSALLAAGTEAHVETVPRDQLAGTERLDRAVGIPGAPDSLPAAESLASAQLMACAPGSGSAADGRTGDVGIGISTEPAARPLPDDAYVWVVDATGAQWLVTSAARHPLPDRSALVALGLTGRSPVPVPELVLADLPVATPVASMAADGPEVVVGGRAHASGALFHHVTATGEDQWLVTHGGQLVTVSATEAALLQAAGAAGPEQVDPATLASAPVSGERGLQTRLPDLVGMQAWAPGDDELCVLRRTAPDGTVTATPAVAPAGAAGTGTTPGDVPETGWTTGVNPVEGARVDPAAGLLAVAAPVPTDPLADPELYLVTDTGLKYPVPDQDALGALGYDGASATPVDRAALQLIPTGPALEPAAVALALERA